MRGNENFTAHLSPFEHPGSLLLCLLLHSDLPGTTMGARGFGLKKSAEYRSHAEECRVSARAAQNGEHRIRCPLSNIGALLACEQCALIDEGIEVQDTKDMVKQYRSRAQELRAIAQGLFDHGREKTRQCPAGFLFGDDRAGARGAVDAGLRASSLFGEPGKGEIRARRREMDRDDEQAKLYRERAEKLLEIAERLLDEESRGPLLEVAMDYLQMAASRGRSKSAPPLIRPKFTPR